MALSSEHAHPALLGPAPQLQGQPTLARAALASQKHHASPPPFHLDEALLELLQQNFATSHSRTVEIALGPPLSRYGGGTAGLEGYSQISRVAEAVPRALGQEAKDQRIESRRQPGAL